MGRLILGIGAGYLVMTIWIMATLSLAWKMVGPDFAFQPGTTDVSMGWIAINIPLSFIGAYLGGSFALSLGKDRGRAAVGGLAIVVLVFGLTTAILGLGADRPDPPPPAPAPGDDMSAVEASMAAVQPVWYNFVIPVIGTAGILLGGRRRPSE